jgi:hypothetical protein
MHTVLRFDERAACDDDIERKLVHTPGSRGESDLKDNHPPAKQGFPGWEPLRHPLIACPLSRSPWPKSEGA